MLDHGPSYKCETIKVNKGNKSEDCVLLTKLSTGWIYPQLLLSQLWIIIFTSELEVDLKHKIQIQVTWWMPPCNRFVLASVLASDVSVVFLLDLVTKEQESNRWITVAKMIVLCWDWQLLQCSTSRSAGHTICEPRQQIVSCSPTLQQWVVNFQRKTKLFHYSYNF